jgi:AraC-like DNA-binding protein
MAATITRSWTVPEIPHLECFRTVRFVHEYPRHSHETWSIGVVDYGTGGIWYRGANQRGGAGQIIAINPGEVHTGYPLQKDGISYSMLYIGDQLVKEILPGLSSPPVFPGVAICDRPLASSLRSLCRAFEFGCPPLAAETKLISDLRCLFLRHAHAKAPQVEGRERERVAQIKEYLRANLHRNVSLTELANLTGLSKAYVIRSFRRTVGMPPYEWLLQQRIEEARRHLQNGSSIGDLAIELGFADQSHFHRRFKSVTGMTPAAYAAGHYRSRQSSAIPAISELRQRVIQQAPAT